MKFIVKYFPEIIIKSKPVRKQFSTQLKNNIQKLLRAIDPTITVHKGWDKLTVSSTSNDDIVRQQIVDVLACTPGIAHFLDVMQYPYVSMEDVLDKTKAIWGDRLSAKTFVVRCNRSGAHDFTSHELEQYVGSGLYQDCQNAGVDLYNAEITVRLELRGDQLFVVNNRHEGLGGFPLGSIDPVLSLISGGFDSTVSSYLTMKRGMQTHFCFFNLGGRDHELGVKEVALYLWMKYGASSVVNFVAVPFEGVVSEILTKVDNSQMGVVLKRMMMRAGARVAGNLNISALVTGESVAQVSSQTLINLGVIDSAVDILILRPLITSDKEDIIAIARRIGTEAFAAAMPEYCGVISVKPTTRAKPERVAAQENKFDLSILEEAINSARYLSIDQVANDELNQAEVEVLNVPIQGGVIIDVRHPAEQERKPLSLVNVDVQNIPFYELHSKFVELDSSKVYLLYCDKGVMSKLHAAHLVDKGYKNVKVYRPMN